MGGLFWGTNPSEKLESFCCPQCQGFDLCPDTPHLFRALIAGGAAGEKSIYSDPINIFIYIYIYAHICIFWVRALDQHFWRFMMAWRSVRELPCYLVAYDMGQTSILGQWT